MFKKAILYFLIISCSFVTLYGCNDTEKGSKDTAGSEKLEAAIKKNKELEEKLLKLAQEAEKKGITKPPTVSVCDRTIEIQEIILLKVKKTDCKDVTDRDLSAIKTLILRDMPALEATDFSGFTGLVTLDLDFEYFVKSVPDDLLSHLVSLEVLTLSSYKFTLNPLSELSSLEIIIFYRFPKDPPVDLFSDLTNLREISIHDLASKTFPEGLFSNIPSLERVDLAILVSAEEKQRIQAEVGEGVEVK